MKIIHAAAELQPGQRKVCLGIGFFDGVHLGHQQIIRQTVTDARQHEALALVITFDRHPNTVVAPSRVPPLIYSLPQKLRAIEALGADALLLLHFDKSFSEQTGEAFLGRARARPGPHSKPLRRRQLRLRLQTQRQCRVAETVRRGAEVRRARPGRGVARRQDRQQHPHS